jgi:hypothetical protein
MRARLLAEKFEALLVIDAVSKYFLTYLYSWESIIKDSARAVAVWYLDLRNT